MPKMSFAEATARFSELVDQAEHHGKRVVILRHGKPAAAIVPVSFAMPERKRRTRMTKADAETSVRAYVAEFSATEPHVSAVNELLGDRR